MDITKAEHWSVTIKRRRLTFLGHIMRLHRNTPAKLALNECFKPCTNKQGRPAITWLRTIKNDLIKSNINIDLKSNESFVLLENLTYDWKTWNDSKKNLMQSLEL